VYIPPENSKYSTIDAFTEIENEFISLLGNNSRYALVGDFNAKTSDLPDFCCPDENFLDIINLRYDEEILKYFYDHNNLVENGVSLYRYTQCTCRPNTYGKRLIELCKKNNIYFVNSRVGNDKYIGNVTCNNTSVVDYLLLSSNMLTDLNTFQVEDFNPLFSDVHSGLNFSFKCPTLESENTVTKQQYIKWNNEKKTEFIEHMSVNETDSIRNIEVMIDELHVKQNILQSDIDIVVKNLCDLFSKSSSYVFGTVNKKPRNRNSSNKPWYNANCKTKRKIFHRCRRIYGHVKNQVNKNAMKRASKEYKREMSKSFKEYQLKTATALREKSKKDPKGLWKLLNNIDKPKSDSGSNVGLDAFYEYFKNQNETPDGDDEVDIDFDKIPPENINNILNSPITEDEILCAVKNLKNNKASGCDNIVNEHIKHTIHMMMPIYCKLFNLILNTGKIPYSWSEGIILPIYKNKGNVSEPSSYRPITLVSCLGKTFTAILNNRLSQLSDEIELITEAQTGFRKGYGTTDNIFTLYALFSIYQSLGKKLYCTFVDFSKAFDSISRAAL
jgi:hypothetical protein